MSVPTPSDEIVFKQTKERYEYENRVSDRIETAGTNLVGWNGLILSVLLAGGGILISKGGVMLTKLESQLLQYTVILLFISLAAAFVGFRVGGYSVVPDPLFLSRYYRTATASDITKRITLGMILAIGKNAKINQKRQIIISVSQISFIIAMITAVIFLVDQVGRFVG